MTERKQHHVVERHGWYYVTFPGRVHDGPWRYLWEAQEYADKLNGAHGEKEQSR